MIHPTVGRIVWFYPMAPGEFPGSGGPQPLAAIVVSVLSDRLVNLAAFDAAGTLRTRHDVLLVQEGEATPTDHAFCTWMPYQIGQAKKHTDEAEKDFQLKQAANEQPAKEAKDGRKGMGAKSGTSGHAAHH